MSLLSPYIQAGVLTFTVRNNEAIADNPYDEKTFYLTINPMWKAIANLPPLPTSGIPDGTVKIEDVEEQEQVDFGGVYYPKAELVTRIVIIPKALRKGEEEKPEAEEQQKIASALLVNFAYLTPENQLLLIKSMQERVPQPEKMDQTAEEKKKDIMYELKKLSTILEGYKIPNFHNEARALINKKYGSDWREKWD